MGFSAYIHLPYCLHRCPYCDFNAHAVTQVPEQGYVEALAREIEAARERPAWAGRRIATVFFGGGTPSLFSPAAIERILVALDSAFGIEEEAEISLEANPGTIEGGSSDQLRGFRRSGVNRLSIGTQTFEDRHLATLGRIHGRRDTERTLHAAREAGFDNLSCDLIFGIPGQTLEEWRRDLARLLEFAPEHVSTYGLTYEAGTILRHRLDAGTLISADEDLELEMYEAAITTLAASGYHHYEISNFARPGHECRHNLTYWTWQDYLGLGAGAHGFHRHGPCQSKVADPTEQPGAAHPNVGAAAVAGEPTAAKTAIAFPVGATASQSVPAMAAVGIPQPSSVWGVRYANVRSPEAYMAAARGRTIDSTEVLDRDTAMSEFIMLGLRLIDGFLVRHFEQAFGDPFDLESPSYRMLTNRGFVTRNDGHIMLTKKGLLLADSVITRLATS